jgi:hypothetical protein
MFSCIAVKLNALYIVIVVLCAGSVNINVDSVRTVCDDFG